MAQNTYSFKLANGKTLDIEGEKPPSDEEIEGIAREAGVQLAVDDTPVAPPINTPTVETPPIQDEVVAEEPVVPEESWLRKAWRGMSEPLTDAPSRFAEGVANYIDQPSNEDDSYWSGLKARGKGFVAGALQGAGDMVSSLTSPVDLAATALSGGSSLAGKAGLSTIAKGLALGAKAASAPVVFHGGEQVLNPESTMSERGTGLMEIAGGLAGMHGPSIPEGSLIPDAPVKSAIPETPIAKVGAAMEEAAVNTPKYKMGTVAVIKAEKATPDVIKKARQEGFEFQGLNDQGDFRFRKTSESAEVPLLESDVKNVRPTAAGVKDQLGPVTDAKKDSALLEALNFPRAVMASMDFSAPLRQGIGLIHKPAFWKALGPMFKSALSEEAFQGIQKDIANRPLFRERVGPGGKVLPSFADDAGLKLTDLTDMTKREEAMMSTWAEKVPGVRPSSRAYTAFLNKLRADTFESLVKDGKVFGADATVNLPLARELASFVNIASGRGSLGKLEPSAKVLSSLMFSPRLMAARLQMMNPQRFIMASPQVRKETLKSLLAVAAAGNTVTQLGRMAGGTVSTDPSSSDFGKLKIGETRLDPYGGFQQYIVAANRLLNPIGPATGFEGETPFSRGQMVTSSDTSKSGQPNEYDLWNAEGPYDPTWASVAGRFARGKANPVLGFAMSLAMGGKEMTGEEMQFSTLDPMQNAIAQRFTPIILQDLHELASNDELPIEAKGILAALTALGMGTQTYGPNTDAANAVNNPQ